MILNTPHILLADDDIDDCDFFQDAVDELPEAYKLTIINDSVELMQFLKSENTSLPNVIFLDLNMPKKSGIECMAELKALKHLAQIPVVIYSTSLDNTIVEDIYRMGARWYIQKPAEFFNIKSVIKKIMYLLQTQSPENRSKDNFIIEP